MTDLIPHTLSSKFKQAAAFLLHPRQGIRKLAAEQKPKWLAPMLVVCAAMLLRVVVGGFFQARATAMGQVNLPPDWQWWTPDMQNNYMQAQQATQGPAFVYLIPAVLELCKIWLGWFAVGGSVTPCLHTDGWARQHAICFEPGGMVMDGLCHS